MSEWTWTFKKNFFFKLKKIIEVQSQIERTFISVHDIQNTCSSYFFVQLIKSQKKTCWGHSKSFSNAFFMLLVNDMVTILRMFCLLL